MTNPRHERASSYQSSITGQSGSTVDSKSSTIILVHVGAGYHSPSRMPLHTISVKNALKVGQAALACGSSASSAVVLAIMSMEDDPVTNAGYGSNLTEDGVVRGDAIVVNDDGHSGAVSAIPHVKNHIQAANFVLNAASTKMSLGRIAPILVASDGAAEYYSSMGGRLLSHDALIEPEALARWRAWRKQLDKADTHIRKHRSSKRASGRRQSKDTAIENDDLISDTVGAIALDSTGQIACGSSSGGLGLKKSGRIGPAALLGVGAYVLPAAQHDTRQRKVAVIASGSGEYLAVAQVCTLLAQRLYDETWRDIDGRLKPADTLAQIVYNFIKQEFVAHPAVPDDAQLGVLAVIFDLETGVSVLQGHNSPSFITGYVAGEQQSATSVSRLQSGEQIAVFERLLLRPANAG